MEFPKVDLRSRRDDSRRVGLRPRRGSSTTRRDPVDKNIILAKEDFRHRRTIIQLNRPDVMNALNRQLMSELSVCIEEFRAFFERRVGIREEEFLHAVFNRGPKGRNASVC